MLLLLLACTRASVVVPSVDTGWRVRDGTFPTETITDPTPPIDTGTEPTETTDTAETQADAEAERIYQAFFDVSVVQQVHLEVSDDGLVSLERDPFTYVPGNVVIGDTRLDNVGIRLKGSSSYQPLSGKAAFKVRFNEYEDQHYGTLERMTLNNMVSDPALGREIVGYSVFQAGGVVSPRASYAQVWLNDSYYGLYTNLESMDEHLVKRWWDDNDGDLWEGNDNADFTSRGVRYFELVSGKGGTDALRAAANALDDANDLFVDVDPYLDLDQYLDFWAYTIAIGNEDGYPYHVNDYVVYQDPMDGRFDFVTWGIDESWNPNLNWDAVGGALGTACLRDNDCEDQLKDHTRAALAVYGTLDLDVFALEQQALTDALIDLETRAPWSANDIRRSRSALIDAIVAWPHDISDAMRL